jgi:hypothetical protein
MSNGSSNSITFKESCMIAATPISMFIPNSILDSFHYPQSLNIALIRQKGGV